MSAESDVQLVKRFGLFLWAHRTIVCAVLAVYNAAQILIAPILAPPPLPQFMPVVAAVAACVFAALAVISFISDRRGRRS